MLAPIDKARNNGNNIIQVVITRGCDLFTCSQCTQLLPFRKDTREMTLDCIEEALHCLRGWPGVIACFGGNPVTHSRFPEVCALWERLVPEKQRGLWTNNLMRHGEIIKKTFWPSGTFNLNVHGSETAAKEMEKWLPGIPVWGREGASHHGRVMGHYGDFGISHEEWAQKRELCTINQNWSGAIYERDGEPYMYFCEVAGSHDGVRGENHGVRCEPGCWEWGMDRFQHQVTACCDRSCVVPLNLKGANDLEETYHVSPSLVPLTLDSLSSRVKVVESIDDKDKVHELTDYEGLRADQQTKQERLADARSPTRRRRK